MQHLENDMDDLFQRAAENYPLKKGSDDWESVAKRIADNTKPAEVIPVQPNKKNKKFLMLALLLLLICGSWITYILLNNELSPVRNTSVLSEQPDQTTGRTGSKSSDAEVTDDANALKPANQNRSNNTGTQKSSVTTSTNNLLKRNAGQGNFYVGSNIEKSKNPKSKHSRPAEENYNTDNYSEQPIIKDNTGNEEVTNIPGNDDSITKKNISGNLESQESEKINNDTQAGKTKKKAATISQKKKGMYMGLFAGPDFSRVKEKSFGNSGFDAGLLLGFRLNSRLSFESGIFWNKKYYSSEGSNFSMDKVGTTMPTGMIIDNLKSKSSVIEIPLKVKYDFSAKKNSGLFVAGGVSSYIMMKERNMYSVIYNGTQQKMEGVYEKKDYGIPAVANLSFGYEHNVSRNINIRIEPYLKIPLQGMGVGSLPVTSAGLHVGITGKLK